MRKLIFKSVEKNICGVRSIRRTFSDETGAALVMALLFLLIIALMVPAAMRMVSSDSARTTNYNESRRAFYIADAGIEVAESAIRYEVYNEFLAGADEDPDTDADNGLLHAGTTTWGTAVSLTYDTAEEAWSAGSAGGSGNYTMINFNDGVFYARVMDNEDESPNDPNVDSDYILQVHVVGVTEDGDQSSIMAAYRKYDIPEDQFPAAVTMVGLASNINANGNINIDAGHPTYAWDLNGYGVHSGPPADKIPNPDTDCLAKNALSLESSSAAATIDWHGKEDQFNGVTNYDTNDDIADIGFTQTDFQSDDAEDMRLEVKDYCTLCLTTGHTDSTGTDVHLPDEFGTMAEPIIVYSDGNTTINAGAAGVGILIIDGDASIAGAFDYAGIIIIGGCTACWGALKGTGTAKIYGAMVIGNNLDAEGDFSGSADIYYSCQGVAKAVEVFSNTFRTVGWAENG